MAETIKVDPEALQTVSNSLMFIKQSVENVVDTLPSIKRMSSEAWAGDDSVSGIFQENCQKLRVRCIELMQSMDTRSKNLDQAISKYLETEELAIGTVRKISAENPFL